jgi:serine/threonine protein phosphatase 1
MASYVVGDIHGCLDELVCLIDQLPLQQSDRLIFLGDYIDRGPNSKGVVSYLIKLQAQSNQELIFLKGNHEDMFLAYVGLPGQYGDMFLYNGGRATLESYGISPVSVPSQDTLPRIPSDHIEFLNHLQPYYLEEPYLCVHAGVNPLKPLENQTQDELLWIRNEFIDNPHKLPYTVIFGHTPQKEILFHLPYKIGLDTGLVYGNKLSCVELGEKVVYQIGRRQKRVTRTVIKEKWNQASSRLMA